MYVAGPLATIAVSLGIPVYARTRGVPGALMLLRGAAIWIAGMLFGELAPRSDLRRAFRELRQAIGRQPYPIAEPSQSLARPWGSEPG